MSDDAALLQTYAKLIMHNLQIDTARQFNDDMRLPRYQKDRLLKHGHRIFSQTDEDGIVAEIFKRIGVGSRRFVEIGTGDGTQCNTAALLVDGWSGVWVEGYEPHFKSMSQKICPAFPDRLRAVGVCVDRDNVNAILSDQRGVDFLSIDIDGNDYWVWEALTAFRARAVCVEYNGIFPPPIDLVVPYDPKWQWDGTNYYGASLEALVRLGRDKGYRLVGCNYSGSNAFFVRHDECAVPEFVGPATAEEHYEPIRFYAALSIGHAARVAPYLRRAVPGGESSHAVQEGRSKSVPGSVR